MRTQILVMSALAGCTEKEPVEETPEGPEVVVPEFGAAPTFTRIAVRQDGLATPRDLAFHPDRPEELFVVNRDTDSVTVVFDPGTPDQTIEKFVDSFGNHFMEEVSSLAFGDSTDVPDGGTVSTFATCQESRNTYDGRGEPNDFMGPALWPGDLDQLAQVHQNDDLLGSHLDMLHQTSFCMGIAHDDGNGYWVFDGQDGEIVFYDFQTTHGYGEDDHSDGIVRHYPVEVRRKKDVPSHLELDPDTGLLYVADTGNGRILVLDTVSGERIGDAPTFGEPLSESSVMGSMELEILVEGLGAPSGIALHDGRLFVSDHDTGEILAYALDGTELGRISVPDGEGIMGLTFGPDGSLWYVDGRNELVIHVEAG